MKTIQELCREGTAVLTEHGIENASWECRELLCEQTGFSMNDYLLRRDEILPEKARELFWTRIRQRCRHIPLQHILGKAYFYGRAFEVTPDVLIPRPETELLVEQALNRIKPKMHVLDLCTGSGCIAVTVGCECPDVCVDASDLSDKALAVARRNAGRHQTDITFWQSDLFAGIRDSYDMILSNPPYISMAEMETLMPEVKDHDPHLALYGGKDGLDFYRKITKEAKQYLKDGGFLMMEIGAGQGDAVRELLQINGYQEIDVIRDLNDLDRVALGRRS